MRRIVPEELLPAGSRPGVAVDHHTSLVAGVLRIAAAGEERSPAVAGSHRTSLPAGARTAVEAERRIADVPGAEERSSSVGEVHRSVVAGAGCSLVGLGRMESGTGEDIGPGDRGKRQ